MNGRFRFLSKSNVIFVPKTTQTMKTHMKKLLRLSFVLLLLAGLGSCERRRALTRAELPEVSQQFITDHFSGAEVSFAKVETEFLDKEYKVVLADGTKLEFNRRGNWEKVDCKYGAVPEEIVPRPILDYVAQQFAGHRITCIECERREYEVELDNGFELKFDLEGRLIDFDD